MTITKQVKFTAKDECIEEMKALLIAMVKPSQDEEGCLFYHITQLKNEPTKFLVLESWRDDEALDFHKNSAHYKHYKLASEPYYTDKRYVDLEVL